MQTGDLQLARLVAEAQVSPCMGAGGPLAIPHSRYFRISGCLLLASASSALPSPPAHQPSKVA